jgi:hypothetical protein
MKVFVENIELKSLSKCKVSHKLGYKLSHLFVIALFDFEGKSIDKTRAIFPVTYLKQSMLSFTVSLHLIEV